MVVTKTSGNIQMEEAGSRTSKGRRRGACCNLFAGILYVFLFLLFIIGLGILVVSVYAYYEIGKFTFLYVGIAVGGLMVIVCLLNIIAVCSNSRILVIIIMIILAGLAGLKVYVATKGVNIGKTDSSTEFSQFWQALNTDEMTALQKTLDCCGLQSTSENPQTCPEGATLTCTQAVDNYIAKLDSNSQYIMYGAASVELAIAVLSFLIVFCSC